MSSKQGKVLVLLSGGMDSTTALAQSVKKYGKENVKTISFSYGSKHNNKENMAAAWIAAKYSVSNVLIHIGAIQDHFKSDLLKSGGEIPEGHYAAPSMKKTVVPFRNGIMLSLAAGYAESFGLDHIVLSNHKGDHHIYPDCREEFTSAMGKAISLGTDQGITLLTPFGDIDKTEICDLGAKLNVPFDKTWSCYKGGYHHCGVCGTCHERKEAFRDSGVPDPTIYEDQMAQTLSEEKRI